MLVYADRSETVEPSGFLAGMRERARALRELPVGLERHSALVQLLIDAGKLLQGVADDVFRCEGQDRCTAATDAMMSYTLELAAVIKTSAERRFHCPADVPEAPQLPTLPRELKLREPEGFAFYAVYPEAYAEAARRLRLDAPPCVIGIRSIGTTVGAMAAAALGAGRFVTVRPFGEPFARRIAIAPELERELLSRRAHFVVVDEGPGQSGSSFGAVADWLQERGVPLDRIAFLPSHGGDPGAQASEVHRQLWRKVQRVPATFDSAWLSTRFGPLQPFATGEPMERMKFLGWAGGQRALIKFAGLGNIGSGKLEMARALHAAGVTPKPLGFAHGFLVERWHGDAKPLAADDRSLPEIAHYIGARARLFPAGEHEGASVQELLAMTRRNVGLAFGEEAAAALACWEPRLNSLARKVARVRTDNKLDPVEWIRLPDGRLLKTDALDHHRAHDLVGAQDMAWDVAGASVEFGLDRRESAWLSAEAGRAGGRPVDPALLEFMTLAYCAFRLGQSSLTGCGSAAARYRRVLRELLPQFSLGLECRESALG